MEHLKHILFIDIETVPIHRYFDSLTEGLQKAWVKKAKFLKSDVDENATPAQLFSEKAGIFSEFAKVVCISFGSLVKQENEWYLRLKSIVNDNEKILLNDFCNVLGRFTSHYPDLKFCGHNIKEFDIPFLCRRMLINGMGLPECMQLNGKKPWEVSHLDTLELWRFGDYKHYTSLALLAEVFGIPSPKYDIDGSMVAGVYYEEKNLARIGKYCMEDVLTSARVFLKLRGMNDIINPVFVDE